MIQNYLKNHLNNSTYKDLQDTETLEKGIYDFMVF